MTRSPADYLKKAVATLDDARRIAGITPRIAAREAYMAAFHAAEALILARTGKVAKTHKGVNVSFAFLAKGEKSLGHEFAAFVSSSYELKQYSDYGTGPEETPYGTAEAEEAIAMAGRMIQAVDLLLNA